MAVLVECVCHRVQSLKNRKCTVCGGDLSKQKKNGKGTYWIAYRLPGGLQRRERIGSSIEEAKDADGKRRVQKREHRIFDILPEAEMSFSELAKWYLEARKDEGLKTFDDIEDDLNNFNAFFGEKIVGDIKLEDLEKYKALRRKQGRASGTIDGELRNVKTMMNRAFDNDMIGGHVLKPFRKVKKMQSVNANVRTRTITLEEYKGLVQGAPGHIRGMIVVGFNTGMRLGEITGLKWSHIDRGKGFIRLSGDSTKEGRPKSVPINRHVAAILNGLRVTGHEYVFLHRGKALYKSVIRTALMTACKKAGIVFGQKETGGFTFHDMRRTVKTLMVEAGIDKVYRDIILGHSLQGMDARYVMPSDEALRNAMDRYTTYIDGRMAELKAEKIANVDQNVE